MLGSRSSAALRRVGLASLPVLVAALLSGTSGAAAGRAVLPPGTALASVGYDGEPANGGSERISLDGDGDLVAFASKATNLVRRPAPNGKAHIYVRDLSRGRTTQEDVSGRGASADQHSWDPMLSADGRHVLFFSDATNLTPESDGRAHIYLRDRWLGRVRMIDVDNRGVPADGDSIQAQMSGDGQAVVFMSRSTNLAPGRTGDVWNVFLRRVGTGRTELISTGLGGARSDGLSYGASIDDSHRWVSFASLAGNLVADDTNKAGDVFLRDTVTGRTTRVSEGEGGIQGDDLAVGSSISRDGRYVGFASHATNLRPGLPADHSSHCYVRDTATGRTISLDSTRDGTIGNAGSTWTAMAGNGRSVLFQSQATNLAPGTAGTWNIYRRDLATGAVRWMSTTPSGAQPDGESWWPTTSGDGRYVGFLSFADDMVPGDDNGVSDVYVRRVDSAPAPSRKDGSR